jgi:hypothetical protein
MQFVIKSIAEADTLLIVERIKNFGLIECIKSFEELYDGCVFIFFKWVGFLFDNDHHFNLASRIVTINVVFTIDVIDGCYASKIFILAIANFVLQQIQSRIEVHMEAKLISRNLISKCLKQYWLVSDVD